MLRVSKASEKNIKVWCVATATVFKISINLSQVYISVCLHYTHKVWSKSGKNKRVISKHFESDTLPAASWWRYNFDSQRSHPCDRPLTTNTLLKFHQDQLMYAEVITHFLFIFSRYNFVSSPRPNRSRYQKSVRNLASSMSWLHADRVWCGSDQFPRRSTLNSTACVFQTTHNSWLPVGQS